MLSSSRAFSDKFILCFVKLISFLFSLKLIWFFYLLLCQVDHVLMKKVSSYQVRTKMPKYLSNISCNHVINYVMLIFKSNKKSYFMIQTSHTFVKKKIILIQQYYLQHERFIVSDSRVKSIFLPSALMLSCFSHSERSNGRLVRDISSL